MKFRKLPVTEAEGAILAHATQSMPKELADYQMSEWIPKGTVLTATHIGDLLRGAVSEVPVAQMEDGDVAEDDAALMLARSIAHGRNGLEVIPAPGGRVNLKATGPGLVELDVDRLNEMNHINPGITVATVPQYSYLPSGGLAATVKIIPFAVSGDDLQKACDRARGAMGHRPPKALSAALVETKIGQDIPPDKGRRSTEARLAQYDVPLSPRIVVDHDVDALADAIANTPAEVVLILTGTATSDHRDTAPSAVRLAGGDIIHYGMPVDPGNLLFIGQLGEKPVIGMPGCARSIAFNGLDWVLGRILCGVPVSASDIMGMGVGGLLKEIPTRPRPRESKV